MKQNVQGHMPRDGSAVEAGKAHTANAGALPGQKKSKCGIISDGVQVGLMRPDVHGPVHDADFPRSDRRHTVSESTIRDPPTWGAFETEKSKNTTKSARGSDHVVL